jgi:hypothetical protein
MQIGLLLVIKVMQRICIVEADIDFSCNTVIDCYHIEDFNIILLFGGVCPVWVLELKYKGTTFMLLIITCLIVHCVYMGVRKHKIEKPINRTNPNKH